MTTNRNNLNDYIAESHILNAKDFGIPQNRERLFFIISIIEFTA